MAKPQLRPNVSGFDDARRALAVVNQYLSAVSFSDNNIADPPTEANINAAFGLASDVGRGFIGVIDDNAAGVSGDVWLCVSNGSAWFYESLTKAV